MRELYYSIEKFVGGAFQLGGKILVLCTKYTRERPAIPLNKLREEPNSDGINGIHAHGLSAWETLDAIGQLPESNIEKLCARQLHFRPRELIVSSQGNRNDNCIKKIIELFGYKTLKAIEVTSMHDVPDGELLIEVLNFLKNNTTLNYFSFSYKDILGKTVNEHYHSNIKVRSLLKEVFINNIDLISFGFYAELDSDDYNTNLFGNNITLQNFYNGIYEQIDRSAKNRLYLNKCLANFDTNYTIKLSIFNLLKNISPCPLKEFFKIQVNGLISYHLDDPIIKKTFDFYKQDSHCKKLIEQLESNHLQDSDRNEVINRLSFASNIFLNKSLCALSASHWNQLLSVSKFFGLDLVEMLKLAPVDILKKVTHANNNIHTETLSHCINDERYGPLSASITAWCEPETVLVEDNLMNTRVIQQIITRLQESLSAVSLMD